MRIIALLESMWGWGGYNEPGEEAPRFFQINPDNHSGRRLYRICGDVDLLVTNSCRTVQRSASHHGIPDPGYVLENLTRAGAFDVLLVCGRIAQKTYDASGFNPGMVRVIRMNHPAARRWTNAKLDAIRDEICLKPK